MVRGERLIKLGNSWFFAKFIEVKRQFFFSLGKAPVNVGGCLSTEFIRTKN